MPGHGFAVPRELDERHLTTALGLAEQAGAVGEVPVGAIVVRGDLVVGRGNNRTRRDADASAHAEIVAIREASRAAGTWRLSGCTLYVTIEPCAMCAGAILLARVDRVVFGAWDDKAGMAGSVEDLLRHPRLNHRPEVQGGLLAEACATLLRRFFDARR